MCCLEGASSCDLGVSGPFRSAGRRRAGSLRTASSPSCENPGPRRTRPDCSRALERYPQMDAAGSCATERSARTKAGGAGLSLDEAGGGTPPDPPSQRSPALLGLEGGAQDPQPSLIPMPLDRNPGTRIRVSPIPRDPHTVFHDGPYPRGDGGTFRSAALRDREPTMGVLQDPAAAIQTLGRLSPDSV